MKRKINKIEGFTLVELLTTLAVVGILLGLLIPALNQVSKTATKVRQKAQFHAIGTALEAFRNDYGDYPPSVWDDDTTDGNNTYYGDYSASQRLAEALVGRDGLGFHPSSKFTDDGKITVTFNANTFPPTTRTETVNVYSALTDQAWQTAQANRDARKGPYLELESANAVSLADIYENYGTLVNSYVLADMYKQVKHQTTGKQIGMPILYYKANRMEIGNNGAAADYQGTLGWPDNTYNLGDSLVDGYGIAGIAAPSGQRHFNGSGRNNADTFYNAIQNPNFPGPPARPYRSESFILHSAGPDGLYGTTDDVFNFETDN